MARSRSRSRSKGGLLGILVLPLVLIAVLAGWGVRGGEDDGLPGGWPSTSRSANSTPSATSAPETPADSEQPAEPAESNPPAESAEPGTAAAVLASLPVKGRAPKTGYDREERFGNPWRDVDRNGCDTRNDILARDLTHISPGNSCRVLTGELISPYTGQTVHFVRGQDTSALVQIDHVVALSNAWQTGAQQLTDAERELLANDPLNLLAVDGSSNSQKGDGDAATWLPKVRSFRCEYVARQISVKAEYDLWVTAPERDAMLRVLADCPAQPALTSALAPEN
jgi:hypothetical protein